jgi:hypothetical protein
LIKISDEEFCLLGYNAVWSVKSQTDVCDLHAASIFRIEELHGVISQKIELFITTAMITSSPTFRKAVIFPSSGQKSHFSCSSCLQKREEYVHEHGHLRPSPSPRF